MRRLENGTGKTKRWAGLAAYLRPRETICDNSMNVNMHCLCVIIVTVYMFGTLMSFKCTASSSVQGRNVQA
jgi:hypothetical protein